MIPPFFGNERKSLLAVRARERKLTRWNSGANSQVWMGEESLQRCWTAVSP